VLVLGELHHVSGQVAQLQVGEAVVAEVLQEAAASGGHDVGAAVAWPGRREQLAAGVEQAGRAATAAAAVLGLRPRRRRNVAATAVGQATCGEKGRSQGNARGNLIVVELQQ